MRHRHRSDRPHGGEHPFGAGFERPSLHALWHAFVHHREAHDEGSGKHAHAGHRFSPHALWHAIGRHHEHRGGRGHFGGGPGGFGGEGDGFPRGRKFSSDDLQLLLLSLIDGQPSHGYELIKLWKRARTASTVQAPAWSIPRSRIWKNSATSPCSSKAIASAMNSHKRDASISRATATASS